MNPVAWTERIATKEVTNVELNSFITQHLNAAMVTKEHNEQFCRALEKQTHIRDANAFQQLRRQLYMNAFFGALLAAIVIMTFVLDLHA